MTLLSSAGRDWTTETLTMTLADQAAIAGHDGQVTSGKPEQPKSRTFTGSAHAENGRRCTAHRPPTRPRPRRRIRQCQLLRAWGPPQGRRGAERAAVRFR